MLRCRNTPFSPRHPPGRVLEGDTSKFDSALAASISSPRDLRCCCIKGLCRDSGRYGASLRLSLDELENFVRSTNRLCHGGVDGSHVVEPVRERGEIDHERHHLRTATLKIRWKLDSSSQAEFISKQEPLGLEPGAQDAHFTAPSSELDNAVSKSAGRT